MICTVEPLKKDGTSVRRSDGAHSSEGWESGSGVRPVSCSLEFGAKFISFSETISEGYVLTHTISSEFGEPLVSWFGMSLPDANDTLTWANTFGLIPDATPGTTQIVGNQRKPFKENRIKPE